MTLLASAQKRPATARRSSAILQLCRTLLSLFHRSNSNRVTRQKLRDLPDYLLADIGITRMDIMSIDRHGE